MDLPLVPLRWQSHHPWHKNPGIILWKQEALYQIFSSQCSEHEEFLLSLEGCLQKLRGDGAQGLAIVGNVKEQGGLDRGWRLRGGAVYKAVPVSFAKQVSLSSTVVRVKTFEVSLTSELKKKFVHYSKSRLYLTPSKYRQTAMARSHWWSKLSFLWPGKV